MKAVIYLRTSTKEQNPFNQESECKAFAINRGYNVVQVYHEQLSGFKDIDRPMYKEVLEMAHKGEIKAVIVWALDRWVRDRDTLIEDVAKLSLAGCKLHSVKESWLEAINIEGVLGKTIQEFMLGLVGSLAQIESERKSDRVKASVRKKDGITSSYKGNKWGRKPLSTFKMNRIRELHSQGLSIRKIALDVGCSIGAVHKTITSFDNEKNTERGVQLCSN